MYIRPKTTLLIMESLYPLTSISPLPPPTTHGNHHSALCFYEFGFLRFHALVISHSICLCLRYFNYHNALRSLCFVANGSISFFL